MLTGVSGSYRAYMTDQRFSSTYYPPRKLLLKSAAQKNPLLLSLKRAITPFSGIYNAPASSQIGAVEQYRGRKKNARRKHGSFMVI